MAWDGSLPGMCHCVLARLTVSPGCSCIPGCSGSLVGTSGEPQPLGTNSELTPWQATENVASVTALSVLEHIKPSVLSYEFGHTCQAGRAITPKGLEALRRGIGQLRFHGESRLHLPVPPFPDALGFVRPSRSPTVGETPSSLPADLQGGRAH